jgi:hypothetical protein
MKQLVAIIISTMIIYVGNPLFAQTFGIGKPTPTVEPGTDIISPPYNETGWHKVHKRTPNKMYFSKKSPRKTDICLSCHVKENKIFDPHTQINTRGDIIKEKCLYCHQEKPDEQDATFETHKTEVKFKSNIEAICMGCHSRIYELAHPVNARHQLKPSIDMLSRMKASEIKFNIILPLDYEGKIMCATCHNPHQKGVMPHERTASKGSSEKFRVRLPGKAGNDSYTRVTAKMDKICLTCHTDKEYEKAKFSFGIK